MMTLDEMKLAVCEKLTLFFNTISYNGWLIPNTKLNKDQHCFVPCNWEAIGLQVCHEAEKLLNDSQLEIYIGLLQNNFSPWCKDNAHNATYEQRLEALCRVWHPERFEKGKA